MIYWPLPNSINFLWVRNRGDESCWVRTSLGTNQFGYEPVWLRNLQQPFEAPVMLYFATLILVRTRIVQFWYVPELFITCSNSTYLIQVFSVYWSAWHWPCILDSDQGFTQNLETGGQSLGLRKFEIWGVKFGYPIYRNTHGNPIYIDIARQSLLLDHTSFNEPIVL